MPKPLSKAQLYYAQLRLDRASQEEHSAILIACKVWPPKVTWGQLQALIVKEAKQRARRLDKFDADRTGSVTLDRLFDVPESKSSFTFDEPKKQALEKAWRAKWDRINDELILGDQAEALRLVREHCKD